MVSKRTCTIGKVYTLRGCWMFKGGSSEVQGGGEEVVAGGENGLLNKWIAREEVEQALDNLKWNTASSRGRWANGRNDLQQLL